MCHANFSESQTSQIALPEDDPKVIRAIIHYLYAGDIWSLETTESCTDLEENADEDVEAGSGWAAVTGVLADVYVTAEKYQLHDLKVLVIEKLRMAMDANARPINFLRTAQRIYAGILASDDVYRDFFREEAAALDKPNNMDEGPRRVFDECIAGGGILALDIVAALCSYYNSELSGALCRRISMPL